MHKFVFLFEACGRLSDACLLSSSLDLPPSLPPLLPVPLQVLNRLRQVLRTMVSSHLGEKSAVSYQLSENQYAANEAEDPFAQALVEYLR